MKKNWILAFILVAFMQSFYAQKNESKSSLLQNLVLEKPNTNYQNSNSLAWIENLKVYCVLYSINDKSHFDFFNSKGVFLNTIAANEKLTALWFNEKENLLQASTSDNYNKYSYNFNLKNDTIVADKKIFARLDKQYNEVAIQNVSLSYDSTENVLYNIEFNSQNGAELFVLDFYDIVGATLLFSQFFELPVKIEKINQKTGIYTSNPGYEYGVFNFVDKIVYFFPHNFSQEDYTKPSFAFQFPENCPNPNEFGFAFANNFLWLLDAKTNRWNSYKISFPELEIEETEEE